MVLIRTEHQARLVSKVTMSAILPIFQQHLAGKPSCNVDPRVTMLCIGAIPRLVQPLVERYQGYEGPSGTSSLDIPSLLSIALTTMRSYSLSYRSYHDILDLLQTFAAFAPTKTFLTNNAAVQLLIASIRHKYLFTRFRSSVGLVQLKSMGTPDWERAYNLHSMVETKWPPHLKNAIRGNSDLYRTMQTVYRFLQAVKKVELDRDFYAFGLAIYPGILESEFGIKSETRTPTPDFPWECTRDYIPHCASVMRSSGKPGDLDIADIIGLDWLFYQSNQADLRHEIADQALMRNNEHPYFYYARAEGAEPVMGLKMVKKGLKCPGLTPHLRQTFLRIATEHAWDLGVHSLCNAMETGSDSTKELGIAFLRSSLADSTEYLVNAPIDCLHARKVAAHDILTFALLNGPELSNDLRELKVSIDNFH
jgi:hypothetical protein